MNALAEALFFCFLILAVSECMATDSRNNCVDRGQAREECDARHPGLLGRLK